MKPALPTRGVSTTVTLREGGREIQLHVLGRGHTDGDLFIYLPKEKVLVDRRRRRRLDAVHQRRLPRGLGRSRWPRWRSSTSPIIPGHGDPRRRAT